LQQLRQQQKRLFFVTNNASKSREQYVKRFASFGITIVAEEVFSSSYAAGAYVSTLGLTGKVLVAGTKGLRDELQSSGELYQLHHTCFMTSHQCVLTTHQCFITTDQCFLTTHWCFLTC
jgi:ribonucleotide monophosphatase NagD (HAD superfamily)